MTFPEAIRDGFAKYVMFRGRSSRPAYWWWYLFTLLAYIVAAVVDQVIGTFVITVIVSAVLPLPNLAVLVRRLHDAGHSGWWILIGILPLIGFIVLPDLHADAEPGAEQVGRGAGHGAADHLIRARAAARSRRAVTAAATLPPC